MLNSHFGPGVIKVALEKMDLQDTYALKSDLFSFDTLDTLGTNEVFKSSCIKGIRLGHLMEGGEQMLPVFPVNIGKIVFGAHPLTGIERCMVSQLLGIATNGREFGSTWGFLCP